MKKILVPILLLALCTACSTFRSANKDTRCYEMRVYYAPPGKLDDLNARFRNHTLKIFEKHGMANIGYWVPVENPDNKLIYVLAHASREASTQNWKDFFNDPEWKDVVAQTEANGKLVAKVESTFMKVTDFSPDIRPQAAAQPRLFELRTYKAAPGKLPNLLARFRDHTTTLFNQHGISQFAYWTPVNADNDTLVYIVDFKNREAADATWKSFRADPKWIAAKKASEVNGPLTTNVASVFMTPTDYSPAK
jgi:heme-degrading monooxygenase HmoA